MRVASRTGTWFVVVEDGEEAESRGVPSRPSHSGNQRRARTRMRDGHRLAAGGRGLDSSVGIRYVRGLECRSVLVVMMVPWSGVVGGASGGRWQPSGRPGR